MERFEIQTGGYNRISDYKLQILVMSPTVSDMPATEQLAGEEKNYLV